MLNLYYKPTCPFCQRVLQANEQIKAKLNLLDINSADSIRSELIAKGGKQQVPFLEDTDKDIKMYESEDIITYLNKNYGPGDTDTTTDTPAKVCPAE